jgi:hypothetical protein
MFGDERGGGKNLSFGFKDMKNREALDMYVEEVGRMIRDINMRFLRARFPGYAIEKCEQVLDDLIQTRGKHEGVGYDDLIHLPDNRFFRRKGENAWKMIGVDGESFDDMKTWMTYLSKRLPEPYMASWDLKMYAQTLGKVIAGEYTVEEGVHKMPKLKRVGGNCPCSRSVRWVSDETAATNGH